MTSLQLLCTNQEDWVQFIAPVLFSYRASVAIPLGMSPFQALFGRQMTLGIDLNLLNECETALYDFGFHFGPRLETKNYSRHSQEQYERQCTTVEDFL